MTCVLFEALTLADPRERDDVAAALAAAHALPDAIGGWAGPAAPGSINSGDLLRRVEFASEAGYRRWRREARGDDRVATRDMILYRRGTGGSCATGGDVWRGLVFALTPTAPRDEAAGLEAALLAMPRHIAELRGWRLSHAIESAGARRWSHMWEQQIDDVAVLRGRYLTDPIHWGHVDGWFDVEGPRWIVDPHVIHCFADTGGRVRL